MRFVGTFLMVLALTAALPAPGRAEADSSGATEPASASARHMIWPGPGGEFGKDNPYADKVASARKAADEALERLQKIMQGDPMNFEAQIEAYYAYIRAEAWYRAQLDLARKWQKAQQPSLHGRVLAGPPLLYLRDGGGREPADAPTMPGENGVGVPPSDRLMPALRGVAGARVALFQDFVHIMKDRTPDPAGGRRIGSAVVRPDTIRPRPQKAIAETKTDEKGFFKLPQVAQGHYRLTVEKEGFVSWSSGVTLTSGAAQRTIYLSQMTLFWGTVRTIPAIELDLIRTAQATAGANGSVRAESLRVPDRKLLPVEGASVTLTPAMIYRTQSAGAADGTTIAPAPDEPASASGGTAASRIRAPFPWPGKIHKAITGPKGNFRLEKLGPGRYEMTVEKKGLNPFRGTVQVTGSQQRQDVVLLPALPLPKPIPAVRTRTESEQTAPTGSTLDRPFGQ